MADGLHCIVDAAIGRRSQRELDNLRQMAEDNLLLAADFSQSRQLKANRGHGFSTVLLQFAPKLRCAGVDEATLHKVPVDNPRRFLSFVPPAA